MVSAGCERAIRGGPENKRKSVRGKREAVGREARKSVTENKGGEGMRKGVDRAALLFAEEQSGTGG